MKLDILASLLSLSLFSSLSLSSVSAINVDCTLVVPPNPLTAAGLATPYQLAGLNQATAGPCNQNNAVQSSFVQGAIIDSVTGVIGIYNPLVIDAGTQPAAPPVVPQLTAFSVVGLWFGNNANSLTLLDNQGSLAAGNCVNGLPLNGAVDVFGEYAYCNAPAWFAVANQMIADGLLVVTPLGQYTIPATATTPALHNQPCPSVRSFKVIDQDQSDNMVTSYLLTATGQTAQDNATNRKNLPTATQIVNASDNRLVSVALAGALGCIPFTAPDLANPGGANIPALPLNELQAAAFQKAPVALVPANDPMAKVGMQTQNLAKVNLYRAGVNQHPAADLASINGVSYCSNFLQEAPNFINNNKPLLNKPGSSPAPTAANTLFTFMAMRLDQSIVAGTLNCMGLLNIANAPFILTMDGNGVVINATLDPVFVQQLAVAVAQLNAAAAQAAAQAALTAAAAKALAAAQLTAAEVAQLEQLQAEQANLAALVAQNQVAALAAQTAAAQAAAAQAAAVAAEAAAAAAAAQATAATNPNGPSAAAVAAAQAAAAQVAASMTNNAGTTLAPAAGAQTFSITIQQNTCSPQGAGFNVQYQIEGLGQPQQNDNFVVTATVLNANGAPAVFTLPETFNGNAVVGANGLLIGTQQPFVSQIGGFINLPTAQNPGLTCAGGQANIHFTVDSYVLNGAAQIVSNAGALQAVAVADSLELQLEAESEVAAPVAAPGCATPVTRVSNEGFNWVSFAEGVGISLGLTALVGFSVSMVRKQRLEKQIFDFNRSAEQVL